MHKRMSCPVLPLIMSSSSKKLSVTINDAGSRVVTSEKAKRPTVDEIVEAEIRLYEKRNNTSIPNESIDTDNVSPVNNTPIPDEPVVAKASDSVSHVKDTPILDETVTVEPGVDASPVVDTPVTDEPIIKTTEANNNYESQPSQSYDDCCNGPNYESEGDCP